MMKQMKLVSTPTDEHIAAVEQHNTKLINKARAMVPQMTPKDEFKQGELIEIRDSASEQWKQRTFIAYYDNRYWCVHETGTQISYGWKYAQKISLPLPGHNPSKVTYMPEQCVRLLDRDEIDYSFTDIDEIFGFSTLTNSWHGGCSGNCYTTTYATSLSRDELKVKRGILKTALQWFVELPTHIRELAFANYDKGYENQNGIGYINNGVNYYDNLQEALDSAFLWKTTKQGYFFWDQVHSAANVTSSYRVPHPPIPQPREEAMVPWNDIKQVKIDSWYRDKLNPTSLFKIVIVTNDSVMFGGEGWKSFDELFKDFEHTSDPTVDDVVWHVCGKDNK
jgi:hypothetical protein